MDDYIIRPVVVEDFVIKIRSLLRRCQMIYNMNSGKERRTVLTFGDLIIDPMTRYVYLNGERIDLRRREFLLLFTLAKREGQVVSRETLRFTVWGDSFEGNIDNAIPVIINRLRQKLGKRKYIETAKGTGYRFVPYPDSGDGIEMTQ